MLNMGAGFSTSGFARRSLTVAALTLAATASTFAVAGEGTTTAPAAHRGAIVTIEDEINDVTLASMKRRVEQAREDGADLIVFEMNTPGGLVSSALEICTYIKNITDLKTVAWVKPSAYSAGAMISLACNEVVMASASKMGDCAPIVISPTEGLQELGKTERAKAESPILKEFRDSAHRRGYDPLLCEAMVRQGYEIWWLEKGPGGERRFVLKDEKEKLLGEKNSPWRPVEKMKDPVSGGELDVRQPVVEDRDLLTLTQSEAVAFGFAKAIVSSENELRSHYGITGVLERFTTTWSEDVADFLSSPVVRTILMMLIMLGVYAEFNAPGHFVGGAVALIALMVFLGAPYITGVADAWEILLVVLGVILLGVEIFVLPGFGVAGILGILLIFVGFIATFVPAEPGPIIVPRMPGTWLGLKTGLQVVFGGLLLAMVGMWALNKFLPKMPGARGLFLAPASATNIVAAGLDIPAGPQQIVQLGDRGRTLTQLRPAGKAQINGRRVDVIAQGLMIDDGREVEIVEISGGRVVVREVRGA
ncbi:MAG TPA: NfeD family protein [Phycisphaerae bacterium]|nr:NfeD family protein [Phycisphaerae bacterium]